MQHRSHATPLPRNAQDDQGAGSESNGGMVPRAAQAAAPPHPNRMSLHAKRPLCGVPVHQGSPVTTDRRTGGTSRRCRAAAVVGERHHKVHGGGRVPVSCVAVRPERELSREDDAHAREALRSGGVGGAQGVKCGGGRGECTKGGGLSKVWQDLMGGGAGYEKAGCGELQQADSTSWDPVNSRNYRIEGSREFKDLRNSRNFQESRECHQLKHEM
eukprot:365635-Chlamydomonas_euryale.AAC.5